MIKNIIISYMARLNDIIGRLGLNPAKMTDEDWEKVGEMMREAQKKSFEEGDTVGLERGKTPWEQAEIDKRDPNLQDPFRGERNPSGGERKG
jgi:hypothetical protein